MRYFLLSSILLMTQLMAHSQSRVDVSGFKNNGARVQVQKEQIVLQWPAGSAGVAKMVLNMHPESPLFSSIQVGLPQSLATIMQDLDPVFILRTGKRTLSPSSGGWDVFFDKVPTRPFTTELLKIKKNTAQIRTEGSRTMVKLGQISSAAFTGYLEITLYNGSPLFNIAAVMTTQKDSTAILYDAGLMNRGEIWDKVAWSDVKNTLQYIKPQRLDSSQNLEVKYRTVMGSSKNGSLAIFPAPHQYFYPLDEAFNLKFTWMGAGYLNLVSGFGMGIRQDPWGDKRFVPWFNAPPNTQQRLHFFCMVTNDQPAQILDQVKRFTHGDRFAPLPGYKTMATHFHNEFITKVALKSQPVPDKPEFVRVLKNAGLDIVKLAEFHGVGHPRGPDSLRLKELHSLFQQTQRLSDSTFLLLPGEEVNNFYGGHWLALFPRPIYWVMSRKEGIPFVTQDAVYGKWYHVKDKEDMLRLLQIEKGLAWVAHARTKGSTGYPDKYDTAAFYKSDTYLGAAWKAIPADLSWSTLSKRVLNLMDDMANQGLRKNVLAESDIFTITEQNEMYAHLNVNYLQLNQLPKYGQGWQSVLDVLRKGKFFVSTGEVLIPGFEVNDHSSGDSLTLPTSGKVTVSVDLQWTFPLQFVEIVSGDGVKVYRNRIPLTQTVAFGKKTFHWPIHLKNRKWVRLEAWDIAANGAFSQMIWLK